MLVLAEMFRERMVASSRVKPGRGIAANSSSTKWTWQGPVVDLVGAVVEGLECLGVEQTPQKIERLIVVRDLGVQGALLFPKGVQVHVVVIGDGLDQSRLKGASRMAVDMRMLFEILPEITCQQLLNQVYRLLTRRAYSKGREPEFPSLAALLLVCHHDIRALTVPWVDKKMQDSRIALQFFAEQIDALLIYADSNLEGIYSRDIGRCGLHLL